MLRKIFNFPDADKILGKWGRVRREGTRTTMTIKQVKDPTSIEGTEEIEIEVNDFDKACEIFTILGMEESSYQENYREVWRLEGCKITIDRWPGIKPLVEIEGETVEDVKKISGLLKFDFNKAVFGSVTIVYEQLLGLKPQDFLQIKKLTFANYRQVLPLQK